MYPQLLLRLQNKTLVVSFDRPVCFFHSPQILGNLKGNKAKFGENFNSVGVGKEGEPYFVLEQFPSFAPPYIIGSNYNQNNIYTEVHLQKRGLFGNFYQHGGGFFPISKTLVIQKKKTLNHPKISPKNKLKVSPNQTIFLTRGLLFGKNSQIVL